MTDRPSDARPGTAETPAIREAEGEEVHLPSPSIWPAALAGGLTLLFFGLLTNYAFCAFGAALMAYALRGWIGELRHDE